MSDDRSTDAGDARDEALAAALEVPPLDDVTRRRLVRRALDEAGPAAVRPGWAERVSLGAVAAGVVALLLLAGGLALVLRDGGGTGDGSRASGGKVEREADRATADEAAREMPEGADSTTEAIPRTGEELATPVDPRCLDALAARGAGQPIAATRASIAGRDLTLVLATRDGAPVAYVLEIAGDCRVVSEASP